MSGTVKDFSNNPIENVSIKSLNNNISGISNSSGSFTISKISPIIHTTEKLNLPMNFFIRNNNLVFSLNSAKRVLIELFNLQGKKVYTKLFETLNKGTHRFPLDIKEKSSQLLFLCVTLNSSRVLKKYISFNTFNSIIYKNQGITDFNGDKTVDRYTMALESHIIDTLVFSHKDYIEKRVWIYKYSEKIKVVMWEKNLRISDELPDWTEKPDNFASYDTAQLYDLIDGGATLYNEYGLNDGITQYFTGGNDKICQIMANNFGSTQKSMDMYKYQKESVSSEVRIPDFDISIAIGDETLGGIDVYTSFDRFNIELSFRGYTNTQSAASDATLFIRVYETKIKNSIKKPTHMN
jgi:hypothetical protein